MRLITKLCNGLNKNEPYKKQLFPALIKLIKSERKLLLDQFFQETWLDKTDTHYFLFYKNVNSLIIFVEKISDDLTAEETFDYELEEIKNGEGETPSFKLKVILDDADYNYGKKTVEAYSLIGKKNLFNEVLINAQLEEYIFKSNSIIEGTNIKKDLEIIHQYLWEKKFLSQPIANNFVDQTQESMLQDKQFKHQYKVLTDRLKKMIEIAQQLNLSQRNKLDWNDGDYVWLPALENTIIIENADMKFIATYKEDNWQIYHYSHYNDDDAPQYKTDKSMIKAIMKGTVSKENRLLFVQDNKPIYLGENFDYLLEESEYVLIALNRKNSSPSEKK